MPRKIKTLLWGNKTLCFVRLVVLIALPAGLSLSSFEQRLSS